MLQDFLLSNERIICSGPSLVLSDNGDIGSQNSLGPYIHRVYGQGEAGMSYRKGKNIR